MILAVDSSALALLVNPAADPPEDPKTGQPVLHVRERVEHLIAGIGASDTLVIPTPVLAEAMVRAEEGGPGLMEALRGLARVKIVPFDLRAAVETAQMTREALLAGDKRSGSDAPWQKVKFDRQIIAIARVQAATRLYADDRDLVTFARRLGMDVFSTWDLPAPPRVDDLFTVSGVPIAQPAQGLTIAKPTSPVSNTAASGQNSPKSG